VNRDSQPSGGIERVSITPVQSELLESGCLLKPFVSAPSQLLMEENIYPKKVSGCESLLLVYYYEVFTFTSYWLYVGGRQALQVTGYWVLLPVQLLERKQSTSGHVLYECPSRSVAARVERNELRSVFPSV
jgi:hypothetical protein